MIQGPRPDLLPHLERPHRCSIMARNQGGVPPSSSASHSGRDAPNRLRPQCPADAPPAPQQGACQPGLRQFTAPPWAEVAAWLATAAGTRGREGRDLKLRAVMHPSC